MNERFDRFAAGGLGGVVNMLRSGSGFVSRYARLHQIFGVRGTADMLSPEIRALSKIGREPARDIAAADELADAGPVERVSALCLRGYTQNQLLRDIDAVSMAHSLEVRVPFLDPVVTDLALALPRMAKLGNLSALAEPTVATYRETGTKKILIDAGRGLLPEGLDLQMKRGFGMPFDAWLRGELRDVLEDALSGITVNSRGLFDQKKVDALKTDFLAKRVHWSGPWLLMMTELWCREAHSNC
jgi:asparagine synthase (glutamine-hydrolysing)